MYKTSALQYAATKSGPNPMLNLDLCSLSLKTNLYTECDSCFYLFICPSLNSVWECWISLNRWINGFFFFFFLHHQT